MACDPALSLASARTWILRDVHQIDDAGPRTLSGWLNERPDADTQIMAVTAIALLSLVEAKRLSGLVLPAEHDTPEGGTPALIVPVASRRVSPDARRPHLPRHGSVRRHGHRDAPRV